MRLFKRTIFWAKNFFFPSACALCSSSLLNAAEIRYSLCEKCRDSIALIQGNKCIVCGKPLISEIETCLPCRNRQERSFDRLWVLFPYIGKYRKLLAAYKFAKNLELADFFAEKLTELIIQEPLLNDVTIVPVPPRPGKIKETGWDQVDHLIKRLKKILPQAPISRCLKRRKSKAQKQLNRTERLENLKGRIFIQSAAPKTALIVDDVITTGSTIEVCAQVLKQAGTEKVYGICMFYD